MCVSESADQEQLLSGAATPVDIFPYFLDNHRRPIFGLQVANQA